MHKIRVNVHIFLGICIYLFFLIGCSSSPTKIPENLSDADLYKKGIIALNHEKYHKAIDHFKALESRYPFGPFSTQGQLYLAYVYLKSGDPQNGHAAANRFIRLHSDHPNVDYAYYLRGLSSYLAGNQSVEHYFPIDWSRRDMGEVSNAFKEFAELLKQYPNSLYIQDARQRMVAIKTRAAKHILHIATYYLHRRAYVAAVNRSSEILIHYQGTEATEPAFGVLIESYQRLGMEERAQAMVRILVKYFPNTKLVDRQGNFVGYTLTSNEDPSLWNIISFGLLDKEEASIKVPPKPIETKEEDITTLE